MGSLTPSTMNHSHCVVSSSPKHVPIKPRLAENLPLICRPSFPRNDRNELLRRSDEQPISHSVCRYFKLPRDPGPQLHLPTIRAHQRTPVRTSDVQTVKRPPKNLGTSFPMDAMDMSHHQFPRSRVCQVAERSFTQPCCASRSPATRHQSRLQTRSYRFIQLQGALLSVRERA
ncbi:hypothetical protein BU25DRAFT_156243 [Macroventuria anomochaeta]|uniref:Uncharacterized protein n=1 Tax=Macroventuria anomochaeta TaxID=301207 RepID=A0ACB6RT89_9PLEO|nr:uncharacterized protein BU25DRAFT_156243 [Macroventuria anomochaeta]KAF2624610.1 hypothetical protein BU25DRAFT_156243 [Macroventuria anomochaeta]